MIADWTVRFDKWLPHTPADGRSPWTYFDDLNENDRFPSASECAFTIYEQRVRDPYLDGYTPLFRPQQGSDPRH